MGVESLVVHAFGDDDVCAFTFCKDFKIRVWSLKVKFIFVLFVQQSNCQNTNKKPRYSDEATNRKTVVLK